MNKDAKSPEECGRKTLLLWLVLHAALCVLVLANASAAASILVLTSYALCVFRLDWLARSGEMGELVRFMRNYWLAACACMLPWLLLVEPALAGSSNDVFWSSLLNLVIPYALNLSSAWGSWVSDVLGDGAGRPQQWLLLAFCLIQFLYFARLHRRAERREEHGPVDPGAGTVE